MRQFSIFITLIFLVLEIYVFQAFKTVFHKPAIRITYIVLTLLLYGAMLYMLLGFNRSERDHHRIQLMTSLFLVLILPKILVAVFLVLDDILRLVKFGFYYFSNNPAAQFPERRKALSVLGIGAFALLSGLFLDGIVFGKYRHRARKIKLKLAGLPESFKGYRIVQISDVHSGSFFHPEKLEKAIKLINEQKPDLVLFTGDMVNNFAEEFVPFIPLFSKIDSKDGKFSVLGNHDYGDYASWKSAEEKRKNVPNLIEYQKQAGFKVMRNQNIAIERNGEQIYILGVENWGLPPFPQYGELEKALTDVPHGAIKILMSHDPTHFDEVVKKHPAHVHLTLSGHTHGMQFGLDLKNIKWSPVQYRYKKWVDLYESEGKYLYVNRGFGIIAYPGRVGVLPEISVFELS